MKKTEAKIQVAIVQYLQSLGIWFCSIPNEAAGSGLHAKIRMAQLVAMGLRSGAPDLLCFLPGGSLLALEVKAPSGTQSPSQKDFQSRLEKLGFKYHVVRSVDDVQEILKCHSIKPSNTEKKNENNIMIPDGLTEPAGITDHAPGAKIRGRTKTK